MIEEARLSTSAEDTRNRIVDVAARLLQEQGAGAVTTRGVAQAAGVQAPAIYRLFGDKDGLLDAVAEHVMATYVAAKSVIVDTASSNDIDPLDDLRSGWSAQIDFGLANPALFTLLSAPDRGTASAAAQAGLNLLRGRVSRIAALGRLRVSEQRAVDLIHAAGTGVVLTLLSSPVEARDSTLADTMLEAVLGQVLTDAPSVAGPGSLSAAVAFRSQIDHVDALSDPERELLKEWLDRVIGHL